MNTFNQHGGDLDFIEQKYMIPRNEIIDFSGNVNPLGLPETAKNAIINNIDSITTYPDKNYTALRESIAFYTHNKTEHVLVGNGSTELIDAFIKAVKPKRAVIVSPAYSEYERNISLYGGTPILFPLEEKNGFKLDIEKLADTLKDEINLLVLCNPNNPTGSSINIQEIERILTLCRKYNIFVMIDETYVEFSDRDMCIISLPLIDKFDNLFTIRGTSKFFAIPGLRLGYALCSNEKIKSEINKYKDPWSVNILAGIAGTAMFQDEEFAKKSVSFISTERNKIKNILNKWEKIKLYDTQANFFLLKIKDSNITAHMLFDMLIKYDMVIRDASDFPFLGSDFLRFCILLPENNRLLLEKLKPYLDH